MSSKGCWCLCWVFLSVQNVHINCFLIKRNIIYIFSQFLFIVIQFFFSARISSSMFFSVAEFVFLDLLSLVLFIWQKGKLFSLPVVLSSMLMVTIRMAPLSRGSYAWLKLTKSKPKKCDIVLLYVFMNKCLAKDGSTKAFTEDFKKRSKNPEKQTKSQVGKKKKS